MFTSSICKHVNKWGKNKDNICGKPSRKRDSRCHKHRYRFLLYLNKIYMSFKHLFDIKPKIIKNKKQKKKMLEQKEKKDFQNKLENEKRNERDKLKINQYESFSEYIDRIDKYTKELIKTKDKNILHNLILDNLYSSLNIMYTMGTRKWKINADLILRIQKKYEFF